MIGSLIASMASSGAKRNMANGQGSLQAYADPGDFFGGNSAQAMDPIGYDIFNALGIGNWNPLQVATDKIPGFHGNTPGGGDGTAISPMTGGNAGLMSAYSNFLRNLGAPPMPRQPQPQPGPGGGVGGPMRGGGGMGGGRPMVAGGAGAGYPGMAALSQMNFGQPNYPQPNTVRY